MALEVRLDTTLLDVFHESTKRRVFVGRLSHDVNKDQYQFVYDKSYVRSRSAIPIGAELDIFDQVHISKKGELFPSLLDRIPDKDNPAYKDYCEAEGVSPEEDNLIILLGTIGKRGPSSFVFEPVYINSFDAADIKNIRRELGFTQHDFSAALGISMITLQRIESGVSKDINTLRHIQLFFTYPEVAEWQLKQTGGCIHVKALAKLRQFMGRSVSIGCVEGASPKRTDGC